MSTLVAMGVAGPAFARPPFIQLPDSPDYRVKTPDRAWGQERVINALQLIAHVWKHDHPNGPELQFNDISDHDGGKLSGHASHRDGVDADVVTRGPNVTDIRATDPTGQNKARAIELLRLFRRYGADLIFWNGKPNLAYVQKWPNHDDHFHVRFDPGGRHIPDQILDEDLQRGVTKLRFTIDKGDSGEQVREAQRLLNKKGASLTVDGDFGDKTEAAVKAFQKSANLVADGVIGPMTWAALEKP